MDQCAESGLVVSIGQDVSHRFHRDISHSAIASEPSSGCDDVEQVIACHRSPSMAVLLRGGQQVVGRFYVGCAGNRERAVLVSLLSGGYQRSGRVAGAWAASPW